jgi:polyferredoxin
MKLENPLILAERFFAGGGWITILILGLYAGFLTGKMKDPKQSAIWRKRSWLLFSFFFFIQLALGLLGFEKFLMTGKLHFPIPALIAAGPAYRMEIGFMPILFISTIILSGPAWCSQLCYFGAFDLWASSGGKPGKRPIRNLWALKYTFLFLVIAAAILLRLTGASNLLASILALTFGLIGIAIILVITPKMNKMFHCVAYCPIGTIVSYGKYINPFRMYIDSSCVDCMACIPSCRYDALNIQDIKNRKPGKTCTYCGDCIASCKPSSIRYSLFGLHPDTARITWIIVTVSIHSVFMGLARI